jgi:hypothetical protein
MRRDAIDFHAVLFAHEGIHLRLINWARYVGGNRKAMSASPMFRLYRCPDTWIDPSPHIPIDTIDGHRIEKAVTALPEKHRDAVRWQYVYSGWGVSVWKACRALAVRQDTLHMLVQDGRTMLKNRVLTTAENRSSVLSVR